MQETCVKRRWMKYPVEVQSKASKKFGFLLFDNYPVKIKHGN